ncbi:hypothetical protein BD324DRAFT_630552 [Kockovaella imperatae]|uniref:Uncharacterized protein n=1 Tax=Kockovaella imperatae TaxID=4999 RepID=A0A1Y1UDE2_9TREE|nr:hypothetical protein BD324DRAFT_630552 [Kockovaella imperatae]ORX35536.1 hypothetical protein BD324DRAFT_630552 [Kockovaella imperatae]
MSLHTYTITLFGRHTAPVGFPPVKYEDLRAYPSSPVPLPPFQDCWSPCQPSCRAHQRSSVPLWARPLPSCPLRGLCEHAPPCRQLPHPAQY